MAKKIFEIEWPDSLGPEWMNKYNLELCLFTETCIGGEKGPGFHVREIVPKMAIGEFVVLLERSALELREMLEDLRASSDSGMCRPDP
jgi:hypothetical protein